MSIGLVIIDYFGCFLPKKMQSFNDECFCRKGIGKLLINMIQVLSNTICTDKVNASLLMCVDELLLYFKLVDFEKILDDSQ